MNKDQIQKIVTEVVQKDPKRVIKSVRLFGSYLHGQAHKDSDIDLLIEVRDTANLLDIGQIQYDLERRFGRSVDLVTDRSLSKYFKDQVLGEAVKIYG